MTTDRELLELAAKAAGYLNWTPMQSCLFIETGHSRGNTGFHWNPLTDDGDALRLAVKLHITIDRGEVEPAAWCYCDWQDTASEGFVEKHGNDPYAATRRAIVRAAAEIGKAMT